MRTAADSGLSFTGIVRSEWIKLRSLRSTWWTFTVLVVITLGLGAQMSSALSFEGMDVMPTQAGMQAAGVHALLVSADFSALVVSVLGVLVIAGEYSTGMIHSTFTAVPRRSSALVAKSLVFAVVTFVACALALVMTIPVSVALLSGNNVDVRLDDAAYWLALLGSVVYLVSAGLIAFGIGAILRNTAGGVAVSLALVLAAPLVLDLLTSFSQQIWTQNQQALLPAALGRVLYAHPGYADFASPGRPLEVPPEGLWVLEPWQAAVGLAAWIAVLFTIAGVLIKRRDA